MKATQGSTNNVRDRFNEAFDPVAREIGFIAREWNALHEFMGMIFGAIIAPTQFSIPIAVWHSTANDRAQRAMLKAANKAWEPTLTDEMKRTSSEIAWLLSEAEKLSNDRNVVIHAPLNILMDTVTEEFSVEPLDYWGNPRAKQLSNKVVLDQYRHFRARTTVLYDYAVGLHVAVASNALPPDRPAMPVLEQPTKRSRAMKQEAETEQP